MAKAYRAHHSPTETDFFLRQSEYTRDLVYGNAGDTELLRCLELVLKDNKITRYNNRELRKDVAVLRNIVAILSDESEVCCQIRNHFLDTLRDYIHVHDDNNRMGVCGVWD